MVARGQRGILHACWAVGAPPGSLQGLPPPILRPRTTCSLAPSCLLVKKYVKKEHFPVRDLWGLLQGTHCFSFYTCSLKILLNGRNWTAVSGGRGAGGGGA